MAHTQPTPNTPNAINADHVNLTYSNGTEAVRDVSPTLPKGEFFGFLGPNGAGKTTMIKTLVTLLRPTRGSITVNGFDVTADSRSVRQSIGYMAQETSIDPELTARENIRFACEAHGVPKSDRTERTGELLELVDLTDVADTTAREFSGGGMKKRLDVATALVQRPPLVFLDEPTTSLDPKARKRLWAYFRELNQQGTTIFLTTQCLEEADQLCDRIAVIKDGDQRHLAARPRSGPTCWSRCAMRASLSPGLISARRRSTTCFSPLLASQSLQLRRRTPMTVSKGDGAMSTTVETATGQPTQANSYVGDVWMNFKRWGIKTLRNPFMLSFALFYPIMFLVLFTGVFGSIATEAISQTTGESVSYVTYIVPQSSSKSRASPRPSRVSVSSSIWKPACSKKCLCHR